MTALADVELTAVVVPMRMAFRRTTWREAVLIEGPAGWGEFSPFPEYPPETTARWLASALEAACVPLTPTQRDRVPVNVTVPAVDPATAGRLVRESGASTAKVKVANPGDPFEVDRDRVAAVRNALGPEGDLRVDVNGAWTVAEAADRLDALDTYRLQYAEQPVATIDEMVQLRRRTAVPIAADESVRLSDDPMAVVEAGAADVLVLKVQPLGGMERTLRLAHRSGLPVVVSSALETSIGLAHGVAAAARLPMIDTPLAHGLGTASLLAGDVVREPLTPVDGYVSTRRPVPDPELMAKWRPDRVVESAILRRLRDAAELLT